MVLLLVDDERYTREGILSLVNWSELGIDRVELADDGAAGYEAAIRIRPEIILTDVLMPKMNGISMAQLIREELPDTSIIFMSAYSDKQYLLSAIELSAVYYIEKPINVDKLTLVIKKTVISHYINDDRARQMVEMKTLLDASLPVLRSEIAILFTKPNPTITVSAEQIKTAFPWLDTEDEFMSVIVALAWNPNSFTQKNPFAGFSEHPARFAESWLESRGLHALSAAQNDSRMVVHLCLAGRDGEPEDGLAIARDLYNAFIDYVPKNMISNIRLSLGAKVKGIDRIHQSFLTADISIQKGFYHADALVAYAGETLNRVHEFDAMMEGQFRKYLHCGEKDQYLSLLDKISGDLRSHDGTPVSHTLAFFSVLAAQIEEISSEGGAFTAGDDTALNMLSLDETVEFLKKRLDSYFEGVADGRCGHIIVEESCRYIINHYMNQDLSLGKIASAMHMSAAHLCVLFKKGKKMTLNQYLTQYRIERAKVMLSDLGFRVKDVAQGVGFSDYNYFIKVFKKETGFTPMHFREFQYHGSKSREMDQANI